MYTLRGKGAKGNVMLEPSPVFKKIKSLKGRPDSKWIKGTAALRIRSHSAKLPRCEKELKENLSSKGNMNN